MRRYLKDKNVLKKCHIYQMLRVHARGRHLSFHTPGHKVGRWDITELSFSDNLSSPQGCIAEAERDIAEILGGKKSFILTDGSTSGVLAMLHAVKACGVKRIAFCEASHKSVYNGCALLGITPLVYPQKKRNNTPFAYTMYELNENFGSLLQKADALFLTSPDYYGNIANLTEIRAFCEKENKLLLIDGAHGGHLHYDKTLYAGEYADMWVDGVHKNLPAFTQGAIVSARTELLAEKLREAVDIFRTTSPSYPMMASVEYAVKYPQNPVVEKEVRVFVESCHRVYLHEDWTKLCALFGEHAFTVENRLQEKGIFAEFCDGNVIMFYLSPLTSKREFSYLKKSLLQLFQEYPYEERKMDEKDVQRNPAPLVFDKNTETEWVDIDDAEGRICMCMCGLFPPCTPLLRAGERITAEKITLIKKADNVFGLAEGKIQVLKEKERE